MFQVERAQASCDEILHRIRTSRIRIVHGALTGVEALKQIRRRFEGDNDLLRPFLLDRIDDFLEPEAGPLDE